MKPILDILRQKWAEYILEIIVIIIGILSAFALNQWNEGRKDRIDEAKILSDIRNALQSDIDNQFVKHFNRAQTDIEHISQILDHIESGLPYHDSLGFNFGVLTASGAKIWTPQLSPFRMLETKGLDILSNEELTNSILDIYSLDYPMITITFDNYQRNVFEYGRPIARRKFISQIGGMRPVNFSNLSNDVEFINTLNVLRQNSIQIQTRLNEYEKKVVEVIEQINTELK